MYFLVQAEWLFNFNQNTILVQMKEFAVCGFYSDTCIYLEEAVNYKK